MLLGSGPEMIYSVSDSGSGSGKKFCIRPDPDPTPDPDPQHCLKVFKLGPERRHESTRVPPGHAFLAWRSSWVLTDGCVHLRHKISWKKNSIRARSSCQGSRYGTEKAGSTVRPFSYKITPTGGNSAASQAGRRVGPALYSLRPHWFRTVPYSLPLSFSDSTV